MMAQTLLIELLLFTARCYAASLSTRKGLPGARSRREIREVADWLRTRVAAPPSLDEMARQAGLSPGHFAALFRQELGVSPLEHLTALRIDEAANRLRSPRAPSVTRLAHELGFSSSQYFSVVFRRQKGCTPSQWRRSLV
jgi:AraC-like DNA-binding protein